MIKDLDELEPDRVQVRKERKQKEIDFVFFFTLESRHVVLLSSVTSSASGATSTIGRFSNAAQCFSMHCSLLFNFIVVSLPQAFDRDSLRSWNLTYHLEDLRMACFSVPLTRTLPYMSLLFFSLFSMAYWQAFPPELMRKCILHEDAPTGICPFTPREQVKDTP